MQPAATVDLQKSQRLSDLIRRPISSRLVQYVAQQAGLVIPCHTSATTKTRIRHEDEETQLPPLPIFIQSLIKRSCVKPGTILGALVFLDRLQRRLAHLAKGMPCTCHRIFLATLIVTSKSLHDTSPKNKHWARYAIYFNLSEINLMEQQLLSLMNYQLIITPEEIDLVFLQYEIYKTQHQRHQQILPTPTPDPPVATAASTTKDHPILPAPTHLTCAQQQPLPTPMEPRYMTIMANDTTRKICELNDAIDPTTKAGSYSLSRFFPMASLSSSSLSSGSSSSSLRTPSTNTSLTSLNLSSSSSLRTPCSSSENISLPPPTDAPSLTTTTNTTLDQDPVLFYPPAHVHHRDTYRSSTVWQKPMPAAPPPPPLPLPPLPLDNSLLPQQDPTLDQQRPPLWTTACASHPHPL